MIVKLQETLHSNNNKVYHLLGRKPLLVAGLGLTTGVFLWQTLIPSPSDLLGLFTWGAIAVGAGTWWFNRRSDTPLEPSPTFPDTVTRDIITSYLTEISNQINRFVNDLTEAEQNSPQYAAIITHLSQQHNQLTANLDRTQINCVVVGTKGVGKTAITLQLSQCPWNIAAPYTLTFTDTSAVLKAPKTPLSMPLTAEHHSTAAATVTTSMTTTNTTHLVQNWVNADVIVFVSEGDITASEFQILQTLQTHRHAVVMVVNKQDRYLPAAQTEIIDSLRKRLHEMIEPDSIVMTSAVTSPIKVRLHQPDGTIQERIDRNPATIAPLSQRLQAMVTKTGESLVLMTTLRQAHQLTQSIQHHWNGVRRDRARPVIEQYQWIAAATAFANPLPSLDLLATGAINAQLLVDLGTLYDQSFSLTQAKAAAQTFAEVMVKLGLVELATQTIAPLLKGHLLTYAAGGIVQGLSAAYLTHIAGLSLVEYLEEQSFQQPSGTDMAWNIDRLGQIMQHVFQSHQRGAFIQNLVSQGIQKLGDQLIPKTSVSSSTVAS